MDGECFPVSIITGFALDAARSGTSAFMHYAVLMVFAANFLPLIHRAIRFLGIPFPSSRERLRCR